MSDVFVSYKAEDRARVRPLAAALEAEGLSLWWDAQIEGGAAWRHSIQEQLDAARSVVVVWSKNSVGPEGRFVHDEASRAQQRGVYLPILLDKVKPPLGFGETQALPLAGWRGDRADPRFQALLAAIRAKIDPGLRAAVTPARRVDRRVLIAGGGVLAAGAAAAVGGVVLLRPKAAASDSIAVMPFANLSADPAQAYFSEGIAEELRNALSRIARLKVVARTSCEAVKDKPATEAAQKLGVATILTGSVRRSPAIIRVSAQLIDGATGVERWSETYDRGPGDALQIQTGIAEDVAQALRIQLAPAERQALASGATRNAAAHDLYLQGRAILYAGGDEAELRQALKRYDAALAADPSYVAALAARARTLYQVANLYEAGAVLKRDLADNLSTARRAVALEPKSADAQATLAEAQLFNMDLRGALERYELAYRLAPGDPDVIAAYCEALNYLGRAGEAVPLADKAIARDPLNPRRYHTRARMLLGARRYPEAIAAGRQAVGLGSKTSSVHSLIGEALVLTGKPTEALPEFALVKSDWDRIRGQAIARARMGDRAGSDRALAEFKAIDDGSLNFQFAEVYAQRGEVDLGIAALEAADRASDPGLVAIPVDALLDPLREDPRFRALVKRLNFP